MSVSSDSVDIDSLPPEMKVKILGYLDTRSLGVMSGVSKSWIQASLDARLWRNTRLVFRTADLSLSIRELSSAERFEHVKSLRVSGDMGDIPTEDAESILR